MHAREAHNLTNALLVERSEAVRGALLAGGFGVVGAEDQLGGAVAEQLVALRAQRKRFSLKDGGQSLILEGNRLPTGGNVMVPAIYGYEICQHPYILKLLAAQVVK
jgi:hypothetical protein